MDREELDLILDRQLRSALAVKPTADFAARLRERLAEQPRPMPFPWRRMVFAGALAASLALAVGVMFSRPTLPEVRTSAAQAPRLAVAGQLSRSPAQATAPKVEMLAAVRIAPKRAMPTEAEVIVPPGQAAAIHQFARNLSEMSVSNRQLLRMTEVFEGELPQVPSYDVKGIVQ